MQDPPDPHALNHLSRALVQLLRHGGPSRGLLFAPDGSTLLTEALQALPAKFSGTPLSFVHAAVAADGKGRLMLLPEGRIRAAQGHSGPAFDALLSDSAAFTCLCPSFVTAATAESFAADIGVVLHGTTSAALPAILSSGGLARFTRVHVHFARGLPGGALGVRSGARASSAAFLFLSVRQALLEGLQLHLSPNGVVLTRGLAPLAGAREHPTVPLRLLSHAAGRLHSSSSSERPSLPVLWVGPHPELCATPGAAAWADFVHVAEGAAAEEGAAAAAAAAGEAEAEAEAEEEDAPPSAAPSNAAPPCPACSTPPRPHFGPSYRTTLTPAQAASVTALDASGSAFSSPGALPPSCLTPFTSLQRLHLHHCQLTHLPASLSASTLPALTSLTLHCNSLQALPEGLFCQLPALQELRLDRNALAALPGCLGACKDLRLLHLPHNAPLAALPASLAGCTQLVDVLLDGTALEALLEGGQGSAEARLAALPRELQACPAFQAGGMMEVYSALWQ